MRVGDHRERELLAGIVAESQCATAGCAPRGRRERTAPSAVRR